MTESVAVAKEADAKKGISPTRSDNSIHRVRNEPERLLGSLRSVINNIRRDGGTPSVDSIATELSGMRAGERAPALLALQQTHGNRYVQRVVSGIQAKLVVGQPGDKYEQEADRVADAVMRMPEPGVQRQTEEEEEELQAKPLAEQIAPLVQKQPIEKKEEELQAKEIPGQTSEVTSNLEARVNAIRDRGQPLPGSVRDFFEPRFGYDFSQVRVHTDTESDTLNHALNARAYTLDNHIVFGANEYIPQTKSGRSLIAHELAHVVQQEGTPAAVQGNLRISSPSDGAEQTADVAARTVMAGETNPYKSPALQLRDSLRTSSLPHPTIQRAVKTWGGEYDTDKYKLLTTPGIDGVDMVLRFKPNKHADAELIGMTQTARSLQKGGAVPASTFYASKVEKTAFESYRIPAGKDAGTMVDRIVSHGNPLYATDKPSPGHTLADTPTVAFWGQHGWRYTDKAGKLQKQDALLKDTPALPSTMKESSQTFETTALAVKGTQEGTFYGSVQWGWEKNAAGKVKKLPLTLVSSDVPSSVFARASELWNKAKTSKGKATIDLPIVTGKYTNTQGVWLTSNPSKYKTIVGKLAKNTRLEVTDKGAKQPFNKTADKYKWWKVTVVDDTHIGKVGWVMQTLLSDKKTK
jgi:hypothetical protein